MSSSINNTLMKVFLVVALVAVALTIGYLAGKGDAGKGGVIGGDDSGDSDPSVPVIIDETGAATPVPQSKMEDKSVFVNKTRHSCNSVDRIQSQNTICDFRITGSGSNANWGVKEKTTFNYHLIIDTDSWIVYKERKPSGMIKIAEVRKFNVVLDQITTGDTEFGVLIDESALDTLKMLSEQVTKGVDYVLPGFGPVVQSGHDMLDRTLRELNGSTTKSPFQTVQKALDWLAKNNTKKVLGLASLKDISGKSYKISWYQQKDGTPMYMSVCNIDDSPISEKEQLLLKRFNIFLDYDVVPHRELKVGERWSINAENLSELYDPFIEGSFSGKVDVTLKEKDENNKWTLEMQPCELSVVSNSGKTTGRIQVDSGFAKIKPEDITVDKMNTKGKVDIKHLSSHHFLFQTRVEGLCDFEGKIYSKPIFDSEPENNQKAAPPENRAESNN